MILRDVGLHRAAELNGRRVLGFDSAIPLLEHRLDFTRKLKSPPQASCCNREKNRSESSLCWNVNQGWYFRFRITMSIEQDCRDRNSFVAFKSGADRERNEKARSVLIREGQRHVAVSGLMFAPIAYTNCSGTARSSAGCSVGGGPRSTRGPPRLCEKHHLRLDTSVVVDLDTGVGLHRHILQTLAPA